MLTVRPEIVDAEIVKILLTTVFKYNTNDTTVKNIIRNNQKNAM